MDSLPRIEIDGASKTIGNSVVLDQIQLTVKPGEMIGLQGVNGSGKTMLLRLISGLIYPTKGHVLIDGKMLGSDLEFPPSIGFLIENPTFLPQYTGAENLQMLSSLHQMMPTAQIESVLQRVGLHDTKYKKYSLGMKQRLGIAAAVFEQPDIILLDEPTNALDESGITIFFLDLTYEEYVWNIPLYSVAFILRLLAIFSIALLIQKYHQPLSVGKQARAWVPLSAVFPISTLLIIWQIYTFPHEQQIWQICLLILNVVDVVAILLLDHLEQSAINREKLVAAAERAHVQDENIEALSQAYAGQRKMTHDYRAQLSTLSELVDQGNLAEVKAFLSEMKDHQSERILLINTHNAAIDAVLNQKDYAGQRQGIDMRFRVNNQYLVISGEESLPDINTSSQYVATGEKQYVLMSQEDYWNGLVTNASPAQ